VSDTIWTPLRYDIKDENATPPIEEGDEPKWCEGTAFRYPTEPGAIPDEDPPKQKAKPITLAAYNQIVQVRNAIVTESVRPEWLANAPLTKAEIEAFKEDIEEWQQNPGSVYEWQIPKGEEDYFHKKDINDLRRLATYPNMQYEQDVRSLFQLLHDWCIDYTTRGMRYYVEREESASSDSWQDYVNTQIAPAGQSHRFWIWTKYPEYSYWYNSNAGIIDLDGVMRSPIAGCGGGGWEETLQTGGGSNDSFWLMQLVQDVHKPVDELATITKALKGRQHWMAYSWTSHYHCVMTCDPYWIWKTWTYYDDCIDREIITQYDGYPSPQDPSQCENNPNYCWCLIHPEGCTGDHYSGGFYEGEDEDIETGGRFFRSWEHYMDQL